MSSMFNVDLSIRGSGGQPVVTLSGELDLTHTPGAASTLIAAVAAGGSSVIVDLAALEFLGYSGLAVLVRVLKWARRSGGDLWLAAPQPQVLRILEATGLIGIFPVYPSVEQATIGVQTARARPSAVWRQPCPAIGTRVRRWRPPDRASLYQQGRPVRGHGTCRPRRAVHNACGRRHPGSALP